MLSLVVTLHSIFFLFGALWVLWSWPPSRPDISSRTLDEAFVQSFSILSWLPAICVGWLITTRQPKNAYGWVWTGLGLAGSMQAFGLRYAYQGLIAAPGSLPGAGPMLILAVVGWVVQLSLIGFALLLFPTGRLPSPGWRFIGWTAAGIGALTAAIGWALPGQSAFLPIKNPYAAGGLAGSLVTVSVVAHFFSLLIFMLFSAVSLVIRFRQAGQVERQQLKWFALAGLIFVAYLISDFWFELPGFWEGLKEAAVFAALPLSVGIAILRHRLYDIDVIIRKTLVYGVVTGLLGVAFLGTVAGLQNLLTAAGGPRSQIATVLSTLVIAALFSPLRGRVQIAVDRRFYRNRYNAERALAAFAATARIETDLDRLSAELTRVVKETMQPGQLSLWLHTSESEGKGTTAAPPFDRNLVEKSA